MQSQKQIAVFGSFLTHPQSNEYRMAEDLGHLLAKNGFKLICGGHGGIVTALVSGAGKGGGEVLGIDLAASKQLKRNAGLNPHLTETVTAGTIAERLELFANADGYIFFTGGIGSLAEFAFIWHSLQVEGVFDRPIICISKAWKHVLAEIKHEQMIKYKYYRHIHVCEQVTDAIAILTNDYSVRYREPEDIFYKECVVFDLDGTIVESPAEEFIKLCENIGYFFHMPDVAESFRKTGRLRRTPEGEALPQDDMLAYYVHILEYLGIDTRSACEIAAYVCKEFKQIPDLYDDVMDTLHHFKANDFLTGIVSTRHPVHLQKIMAAHNLAGLFHGIVGSRNRTVEKPDLIWFDDVSKISGFPKEGMIHIGDDFQEEYPYPRAIEVDSILLDRHLSHIHDDNTFKIRSLRELRHIIKHPAA